MEIDGSFMPRLRTLDVDVQDSRFSQQGIYKVSVDDRNRSFEIEDVA